MDLKQIYEAADAVAPFALSEEYIGRFGAHDNSGILLDCGREASGVLFSLDLSLFAIEEAKKRGCNVIFTHHPAIWEPVKRITEADTPALFACVKEGIGVLSAHLNLDAAEGGIDGCLMEGLGGTAPLSVMEELQKGSYGRVYDVAPRSLKQFTEKIGETLGAKRVIVYGERPVSRVASFCGGGFTQSALTFACANGADTLVSSDAKHHLIAEAVERGLNVVLLTHYAAECYGFERFYLTMKKKLGVPCFFFRDERFL